jgi:hypothetical protein
MRSGALSVAIRQRGSISTARKTCQSQTGERGVEFGIEAGAEYMIGPRNRAAHP